MAKACKYFGIFPKHAWGPWTDRDTGELVHITARGRHNLIGNLYLQERRCQNCNRLQVRQIHFLTI